MLRTRSDRQQSTDEKERYIVEVSKMEKLTNRREKGDFSATSNSLSMNYRKHNIITTMILDYKYLVYKLDEKTHVLSI